MRIPRTLVSTAIALSLIASTPAAATAQEPLWDWCAKLGDYYIGGVGYHVIYCEGQLSGSAFYYIKHGTPFSIERVT
jgi:hypothetical protein